MFMLKFCVVQQVLNKVLQLNMLFLTAIYCVKIRLILLFVIAFLDSRPITRPRHLSRLSPFAHPITVSSIIYLECGELLMFEQHEK